MTTLPREKSGGRGRGAFWFCLTGVCLLAAALLMFCFWQDTGAMDLRPRKIQERVLRRDGTTLLVGRFHLKVNLPLNPWTTVHYAIPWDKENNRPLPSASRICFWAPYDNEISSLRAGLYPRHLDFCQRFGWTVFTLGIDTPYSQGYTPEGYFSYVSSDGGWFPVFHAIPQILRQRHGLAEEKLVVASSSSGGALAQNLCLAFPQEILAATWCGSRALLPLSRELPPVLATSVWGDLSGVPAVQRYQELAGQGDLPGKIWTAIGPPQAVELQQRHPPGEELLAFMQDFLWEATQQKERLAQGEGLAPSPEFLRKWQWFPQEEFFPKPWNSSDPQVLPWPACPQDAQDLVFYFPGQSSLWDTEYDDTLYWLGKCGMRSFLCLGAHQDRELWKTILSRTLASQEKPPRHILFLGRDQGADLAWSLREGLDPSWKIHLCALEPNVSPETLAHASPAYNDFYYRRPLLNTPALPFFHFPDTPWDETRGTWLRFLEERCAKLLENK
ncbi:MAG: hypothetical protein ACI4SG_02735 [Oligosphaeraceae bacterium]